MIWNKSDFEKRLAQEGLEVECWGMRGEAALEELTPHLSFHLDQDTSSFIEQIGNVNIEDFSLIFMGSLGSQNNCLSISKSAGLLNTNNQFTSLIIMDHASMSYVLHADGTVKSYENDVKEVDNVMDTYESFSHFIEELIQLNKELNS